MNSKKVLLIVSTLLIIISLSTLTAATNNNDNTTTTTTPDTITTKTVTTTTQDTPTSTTTENKKFASVETGERKLIQQNTTIKTTPTTKQIKTIETTPQTSNKGVDGGNFTELQQRITNATNGSTIELNHSYIRGNDETTFTEGIIINKTIIINGNGYNITGTSSDGLITGRIFNIMGIGNLTLKNITLTQGKITDASGGAIVNEKGILIIINSTLTNNSAERGGAIYGGYSNITGSNFINNTSEYGSAIEGDYNSIVDSDFINNNVKYSGGAIKGGYSNITGSSFINNTANDGGAIEGDYNNITGTNFINNTAASYAGGAIIGEYNTIIDSSFINNNAEQGGAIIGEYNSIVGSDFINNGADYGGVIYGGSNSIVGSDFINNSATNYGGAIYGGSNNINSSNFINNRATKGGGVIIGDDNNIIDSSFINNTANNGGAIFNNIGNLNVSNSIFVNNTATTGNSVYNTGSGEVYLNNNWWGNNNPVWALLLSGISDPDNCVVMNFTNSSTYENNKVTLKVFVVLNTTGDIVELPERLVTFSSTIGTFDPESTNFTKEVTTIYTGDRSILKASIDNQELNLDLTKTMIYINETNINTIYGEKPIVNAIVTSIDGQKVTQGNITFIITKPDGTIQEYNTTLINNNIATLNITDINSYLPGTYNITIKYVSTNSSYNNSENNTIKQWKVTKVNTNIKINNITAHAGDNIKLTANITSTYNMEITGLVAFKLNGHTIGKTNITNGQATLNYIIPDNYSSKDYTITAVYGENNVFTKATNNTTLTLVKKQAKIQIKLLNTYAGTTINLTTNTTDIKGTPLNTGTIVYKINGKTIGKTNIINGIATLEYKIPENYSAKNYTITAVLSDKNYQRTETN
ncbi:MAG: Ig-like domain repeat protein, partial [Methanobacteriaceae archaeon]|nr:Ig-like domain repeat protein [Methanobacteriaceae archaeon]